MNEENFNPNNLVAVSIDLLYEGMDVQEDVYDADAGRLLIKRGAVLTAESIERIKSINSGRGTIRVSGNTYRNLMDKMPQIKADNRLELEQETGYKAVKDETLDLLNKISHEKAVEQESLNMVSTELSNRLEVTSPNVILSLINALAPVDEYLQRHCVDVGMLNGLIGRWLNLPKADVDRLVLIGLLHDCGKALIPSQVLNAPRKLTLTEFEVIKMHTVYGYELLSEFPETVRSAARGHHEKVGGIGYPDRLSPDRIPMESRITAVSDIYDAMVSQRAYKKPRSPFSIMAVLSELSGSDLDPGLVKLFNQNMPRELIDKQVKMSDGTIGIFREILPDDIEYPMIEVDGHVLKSSSKWYCTSMYTE